MFNTVQNLILRKIVHVLFYTFCFTSMSTSLHCCLCHLPPPFYCTWTTMACLPELLISILSALNHSDFTSSHWTPSTLGTTRPPSFDTTLLFFILALVLMVILFLDSSFFNMCFVFKGIGFLIYFLHTFGSVLPKHSHQPTNNWVSILFGSSSRQWWLINPYSYTKKSFHSSPRPYKNVQN